MSSLALARHFQVPIGRTTRMETSSDAGSIDHSPRSRLPRIPSRLSWMFV